ncbi:hypothetical protein HAX54_004952, partial [Datura stramonium]|nr:hypothetical protein [Datura stramonium]
NLLAFGVDFDDCFALVLAENRETMVVLVKQKKEPGPNTNNEKMFFEEDMWISSERTLRRAVNAQERETSRLQQLDNAQGRGNNQHIDNNKNVDVIKDEENERNVEDVALENHR